MLVGRFAAVVGAEVVTGVAVGVDAGLEGVVGAEGVEVGVGVDAVEVQVP